MLKRIAMTDRWLLGIVGGAVLLIIVALVVVFTRSEPAYRTGNSPADVVFNYILAVKQGNYERAYQYLSPSLPGYPASVQTMRRQLAPAFAADTENDVSYAVVDPVIDGDRATITVRETIIYRGSGLLGGGQFTNSFTYELQQEAGEWRIISSTHWRVWQSCWEREGGC